jgi:hypothetical protein
MGDWDGYRYAVIAGLAILVAEHFIIVPFKNWWAKGRPLPEPVRRIDFLPPPKPSPAFLVGDLFAGFGYLASFALIGALIGVSFESGNYLLHIGGWILMVAMQTGWLYYRRSTTKITELGKPLTDRQERFAAVVGIICFYVFTLGLTVCLAYIFPP